MNEKRRNIPAHLFSSRPVITLIHKSISCFYSPCLHSVSLSGFGVFASSFRVNSSQLSGAVSDWDKNAVPFNSGTRFDWFSEHYITLHILHINIITIAISICNHSLLNNIITKVNLFITCT